MWSFFPRAEYSLLTIMGLWLRLPPWSGCCGWCASSVACAWTRSRRPRAGRSQPGKENYEKIYVILFSLSLLHSDPGNFLPVDVLTVSVSSLQEKLYCSTKSVPLSLFHFLPFLLHSLSLSSFSLSLSHLSSRHCLFSFFLIVSSLSSSLSSISLSFYIIPLPLSFSL